ncbi:MAG TPA: hypothetical protein VL523_14770 [Terriglobia bacterium]|nr:hypothetical protein [Terriglobia bacterium]
MASRHRLSEDDAQFLEAMMNRTRDKEEYRRALCISLHVGLGMTASWTAKALGFSVRGVGAVMRRFERGGVSALQDGRRPSLPAGQGAPEALRAAVAASSHAADLRRLLCVWLPVLLGLSLPQVAQALGCSVGFVRGAQKAYLKAGPVSLGTRPPAGGEGARLLSERAEVDLQFAMKRAPGVPEYRRAITLFLRAVMNLSDIQVGRAVGFSQSAVAHLYTDYLRRGVAVLLNRGRGGVRRRLLTIAGESELLAELREEQEPELPPGMIRFGVIHRALEARVGRPVRAASVHAMLDRHGWGEDVLVTAPVQLHKSKPDKKD